MAKGGKNINPSLFKDKLTDDVERMLKDIAIVQYAQLTGKCPRGHSYCLNRKCWIMEEDNNGE